LNRSASFGNTEIGFQFIVSTFRDALSTLAMHSREAHSGDFVRSIPSCSKEAPTIKRISSSYIKTSIGFEGSLIQIDRLWGFLKLRLECYQRVTLELPTSEMHRNSLK